MNYQGPEDESLQYGRENTANNVEDGTNKYDTYKDALLAPQECVENVPTKLTKIVKSTRGNGFGPLKLFPS
eukprot:CAMPEP_0178935612 /NCGR_PEP_ID=MMETSP0786-20121207/24654_1 /TAXON_ID=186022 /ORGANISM="Thalassionema frauenfeldii, Strain CCMP 1798" /LENGTH=70 /DNA_ID=CAMNT_0020613803 /DNA_START=380 /DNA_END=588 /DNA_ORIENTATION=-